MILRRRATDGRGSDDVLAKFKEGQRQGWKHFIPLEMVTTPVAARLVKFAGVRAGHHLLDVACGTGVVAITAARSGAHVTARAGARECADRQCEDRLPRR